jgi:SRSO17 transposase
MTHASEAHRWANQLDDLVARISPRFSRVESRRRVRAYLQGLLAPLKRKNGWHLAEAAGEMTPGGVQDFLARTHWDADAVRDARRASTCPRESFWRKTMAPRASRPIRWKLVLPMSIPRVAT